MVGICKRWYQKPLPFFKPVYLRPLKSIRKSSVLEMNLWISSFKNNNSKFSRIFVFRDIKWTKYYSRSSGFSFFKTAIFSLFCRKIHKMYASWFIKMPNWKTHPKKSIFYAILHFFSFSTKECSNCTLWSSYENVHKIMVFNSESNNSIIYQNMINWCPKRQYAPKLTE